MNNFRIFLRQNTPWNNISPLFPQGIPVLLPFPTVKILCDIIESFDGEGRSGLPTPLANRHVEKIYVWQINFNLVSHENKHAIALEVARLKGVSVKEVLKDIAEDIDGFHVGSFPPETRQAGIAINHHWVERFEEQGTSVDLEDVLMESDAHYIATTLEKAPSFPLVIDPVTAIIQKNV